MEGLVRELLNLSRMKVRGIKINYILNLTRTILTALIGFFTMPFINKTLGVASVGKYEYINSIISYFVLFSALGVPMYGLREIAKVRDSKKDRSIITIELLLILLVTSFISYLVIFGILINLNQLHNYKLLILILCPTIFLTNIGAEWFFQAIEDQMYITIRFLIVKAFTLAMLFTMIQGSDDYLKYAFIMLISSVGSNIFNIFYIRKYIDFKYIKWKSLSVKRHIKGIITIFLATVSISIYLQLDNTLLGIYGGDKHVGVYAVANKLIRFGIMFVTTLGAVMLPRLSYLYDNNQINEYNFYLNKSLSYILMFSVPLSVLLLGLADEIILVMAGNEFVDAIFPMKILSSLMIIISFAYFLAFMVLYPQGKERLYTLIVFASAIISVVLNIIFIPKYFEVATSYVNVAVEILGLVLMIYFTRKQLIEIGIFSVQNLNYFIAGILMFTMIFLVSKNISPDILSIIISTSLGLIIYLLYLIVIKDKIIFEYLKKLKK